MNVQFGKLAPKLLVSVRSVEEAVSALDGGADIIDVKEPDNGPLGRADWSVIQTIARLIPRSERVQFSFALGELSEIKGLSDFEQFPDLRRLIALGFFQQKMGKVTPLAKIGFAATGKSSWRRDFESLHDCFQMSGAVQDSEATVSLIPVAYADCQLAAAPSVWEVLDLAIQLQIPYLLCDTYLKDGCTLFDWLTPNELAKLIGAANKAGMEVAVAGSLRVEDFAQFVPPLPAIVGVRGAACAAGVRTATIDPNSVTRLKDALMNLHVTHSEAS